MTLPGWTQLLSSESGLKAGWGVLWSVKAVLPLECRWASGKCPESLMVSTPNAYRCPTQCTSELHLMLKWFKRNYLWRKICLWFPVYQDWTRQLDTQQLITEAANSENTASSSRPIASISGIFRGRNFRSEFSEGKEKHVVWSWGAKPRLRWWPYCFPPPGVVFPHCWPHSCLSIDLSLTVISLGRSSLITWDQYSVLLERQRCPLSLLPC